MYDKVKLWIDRGIVGEHYPSIPDYLDEANTQINHQTGEVKTFGSLGGLKVSVFVSGLSITGSLPKFLYGSNIYSLDRKTTGQALEKIEDAFHINIGQAAVTGVEFGTNFLMRHQVSEYLIRLGDMPRQKRYHFDLSTLYYKGTGRQKPKVFAFYDKAADAKAKGMECPEAIKGANLLRYEMRLNGRLPQQIGVPEVKASTLAQESFFRIMVKRYQDNYFAISKHNKVKTDIMDEIKTPTDALNVFIARLISQADPDQIRDYLDELKEAGVFADRKNYSRLKKKIQEIATKATITTTDELIRELDDEVKNCGAYI